MLISAVIFLVVITIPLYYPDLPSPLRLFLATVNVLVWGLFLIDYLLRLWFADRRGHFIRVNLIDLLVLAVPFLRPLRVVRAIGLFGAISRRAGGKSQGRTTSEVFLAVGALVVLAGGLVLDAERGHQHANIRTPSDALWWAMSTVTTVGYGDRYPTTGLGRIVGVLLMLVGIALLGVVSGGIATSFIKHFTVLQGLDETVEELDDALEVVSGQEDFTLRALAEINERMGRLEQLLLSRTP